MSDQDLALVRRAVQFSDEAEEKEAFARLVARIEALEAALRDEWSANHAEHCDNTNEDHADGSACHWPLPEVLKGTPE